MYKSPYLKYLSSIYNVLPRRVQHAFIRTDIIGSVHYVPDESVSWDLPIPDSTQSPQSSESTPSYIFQSSFDISNAYFYIFTLFVVFLVFPLPYFLCGFFLGGLVVLSFGLVVLAFAGEVIVDEIEEAYFKERMIRRNSAPDHPSVIKSLQTHCPPLQEWMTLQTTENKVRTVVFSEFWDDLLVVSYPRQNIDPQNVKTDIRTAEFVQRKKISIFDASVYLLPSKLSVKKLWVKKHPICVDMSPGTIYYLFFYSRRSKEVWYRRLSSATSAGSVIFPPISSVTAVMEESVTPGGLPSYENDFVEDGDEAAKRLADFMLFMRSTTLMRESAADWLNMLTRRLFYHICTTNQWRDKICRKFEHKFKNIDLPSILDGIEVNSIEIGSNFPEILKLNKPQFDGLGVWLDLNMVYGGGFRIQLQTKLNLFKLTETCSQEESEYSKDKAVRRILNRVRSSSYFRRALELKLIKNSMENIANTPLVLDVEVTGLEGTMTINLPNPPTDRLWFGFRGNPQLCMVVRPKVGEISINELLCKAVKKMLLNEFEREAVFPNMVDIIIPLFVSPQVKVGSL